MTETEKVKLKVHEYPERSSCLFDVHEVLRSVYTHLTIWNAPIFLPPLTKSPTMRAPPSWRRKLTSSR